MNRFIIVAVLLLSGCATANRSADLFGGPSETRISADSYQIFAEMDTAERAGQMLELRAAELTLKAGYQKFIVLKKDVRTERRTQMVSGPSYVVATPTASGGFGGTRMLPPSQQILSTEIGKGEMTIRMVKDAGTGKAIDAAATRARLEPLLKNG